MFGYKEQLTQAVNDSFSQAGLSREDIGRVTPDALFEQSDRDRHLVTRARALALKKILGEARINKRSGAGIEIGSGRGELYRLLECLGISLDITYSDIVVDRVRRYIPDKEKVLMLDALNIELPDKSEQFVIVYNLLDQFADPHKPLSEMLRVLHDGCPLVCLTDMCPDEYAFFQRHPDKYLIRIPKRSTSVSAPYFMLTKDQADEFGSIMQPLAPFAAEFWQAYVDLPAIDRAVASRLTYASHFVPMVSHNFLHLLEQGALSFQPEVDDMIAESQEVLTTAMQDVGFSNVKPDLKSGFFIGKPAQGQQANTVYEYIFGELKHTQENLSWTVKELTTMGAITAIR